MTIYETAAQYGIAAVAIVACAAALWMMYKFQNKERQALLDRHEAERRAEQERHQRERQALTELLSTQHTEAMEMSRQVVKVTTELTTYIRAKM